MNKIWANQLIAGSITWDSMPVSRQAGVQTELAARVASGEITAEKYEEITGTPYTE